MTRFTLASLLLATGMLAACGGDDGPSGTCSGSSSAPATAAIMAIGDETFSYGSFTAGDNNDCPSGEVGAPVSVTIAGQEVSSGFFLTLCLPRPDLLEGPVAFNDPTLVQLVDLGARDANNCNVLKHPTASPSGTIEFIGLCTASGASFTMRFAGSVAGLRSCGGDQGEAVELVLAGEIRVSAE